ncbi:AAA family ATPase [Alcaligenes aquatilis]|uniref:AAA family ATPase n=1 Tax=Alcaligenes aquatilis TaxID=323284 RepID=UPI0038734CFA
MHSFVLISGCSGGGKSTLLAELQKRGHTVIQEPGRRIVQEQLAIQGSALPWLGLEAFLQEALKIAQTDYVTAAQDGSWVFFDRGLIDAAAALQELRGHPLLEAVSRAYPYHPRVFLTPPWPQIYKQDPERRHDINAALHEYERLTRIYPLLGYQVSILPKTTVQKRADFVLNTLGTTAPYKERKAVKKGCQP